MSDVQDPTRALRKVKAMARALDVMGVDIDISFIARPMEVFVDEGELEMVPSQRFHLEETTQRNTGETT